MAIVPHTHPPTHALDPTIAPPEPGFRWECRVYPGQLALISQVRTDMCTDLNRLVALPEEAREEMVLCASEMFANACDHSRSGHDPDGRVVRTLEAPVPGLVRVSIIDDGARTDTTVDSLP
ncbi:ATP-binding protein, partial [Nocardiopsis sp. NPDC007018]